MAHRMRSDWTADWGKPPGVWIALGLGAGAQARLVQRPDGAGNKTSAGRSSAHLLHTPRRRPRQHRRPAVARPPPTPPPCGRSRRPCNTSGRAGSGVAAEERQARRAQNRNWELVRTTHIAIPPIRPPPPPPAASPATPSKTTLTTTTAQILAANAGGYLAHSATPTHSGTRVPLRALSHLICSIMPLAFPRRS